MKIIFGFVGQMASGKDTAANYLEKKYNGKNYSFSGMLADVLKRFYLELNRDNYVKISEGLREKFGDDLLSKTLAEDIKKDEHQIISVSNVRRPNDVKFLKDLPGFVLVEIFAEPKTRFDRLTKRGEKSDDNNKTYEQFLADHQRSTELTIDSISKEAIEKIDNNGTFEMLYQQLDELVERYSEKDS